MVQSNLPNGPYMRIARRIFFLVALSVVSFLILANLGALFPPAKALAIAISLLALASFAACAVTVMVKTRCPHCGWSLSLTKTKLGMPWSHPWPDKVCSNCRRDPAKRLADSGASS